MKFHQWLYQKERVKLLLTDTCINVKDIKIIMFDPDDDEGFEHDKYVFLIFMENDIRLRACEEDLNNIENAGLKFEGCGIDCVVYFKEE